MRSGPRAGKIEKYHDSEEGEISVHSPSTALVCAAGSRRHRIRVYSSGRGVSEMNLRTVEMPRPRVKICCIESAEEAHLAVRHGADALGLVSSMPSGPGVIPDSVIGDIAATVPQGIETFLLTSRTRPGAIAEQFDYCGTTTIQIVDWIGATRLDELRKLRPQARLVQVIHVSGRDCVDRAIRVNDSVDAILLDSGRPDVRELGGTGRTHDWSVSREIVESVEVPVYLAGGLDSSNVVEGVESVRPYGIDLCTGVRTNGTLDDSKLAELFRMLDTYGVAEPQAS